MKKLIFLDIDNVLIDKNKTPIPDAITYFKKFIFDTGGVIVPLNKNYAIDFLIKFFNDNGIDADIKEYLPELPIRLDDPNVNGDCLCTGNRIEYYLHTMDWKDEPYSYVIIDTKGDYLLKQGNWLISIDPDTGFDEFDAKNATDVIGIIPSHRYTPSKVRHPKLVYIPKEPEPLPPCCYYRTEQEMERDKKKWMEEEAKIQERKLKRIAAKASRQ